MSKSVQAVHAALASLDGAERMATLIEAIAATIISEIDQDVWEQAIDKVETDLRFIIFKAKAVRRHS